MLQNGGTFVQQYSDVIAKAMANRSKTAPGQLNAGQHRSLQRQPTWAVDEKIA